MKNAGYTIKKKEIYNHTEMFGVALGWNGKQAVTWEFNISDEGEYSFFWGHYFTDFHRAMKDYHDRLSSLYDFMISEDKTND